MRKYLLVILFLSIGFGQDVLTLKKGASYEGEFLGIKSGKVHFQPTNTSELSPRRFNEIRELTQNGQTLIQNGKWLVDKDALSIKFKEKDSDVELPIKDDEKRQFSMEKDKSNGMQKFGGLLIGVGGLLVASTYQDLSDVEYDDLEKKIDAQRLRGQIGGALIALGGLLSVSK
mgnify:CR=1 FL=1|tara:strand:- start:1 stop:519 length:519 start_codon:yes stop_codon:yes gene_type:complete